jgi:hypothetical protein
MKHRKHLFVAAAVCAFACAPTAQAVTTSFFSSSQTTNLVSTNATSDTISSEGYLFEYTRDKLFTGGVGLTNPIGRAVRIPWPDGLEAQYVTTSTNKAKITVRRVDGGVFDLTAFTAKLLGNAGAGREIEIVPLLNGEAPLKDPLFFDVSGNYGMEFSYDTSPNYLGTTAALTNYDAYVINLTLDYALMSLTVVDASIPPPILAMSPVNVGLLEISWPVDAIDYTLESATNLPATVWNPVTNTVVINGDRCTVQLESSGSQMMYRLRK